MARSTRYRIAPPASGSVLGLDRVLKRIAALEPATIAAIAPALDQSAEELVDNVKAIAPVSDLEKSPGRLRDSVHREPGATELTRNVVVDAKDDEGRGYAAHVEFGHKAENGRHVPPTPFLFPAARVMRKKLGGRISRAMGKAIKQAAAGAVPS